MDPLSRYVRSENTVRKNEAPELDGDGLLSTTNEKLKVPLGAVKNVAGAEPKNVPEELTV